MSKHAPVVCGFLSLVFTVFVDRPASCEPAGGIGASNPIQFDVRSHRNGKWSDPETWQPAVVPGSGQRVLISRGTTVEYDVASDSVIRFVQVVGTLRFSRDQHTLLNVGVLKVQNSEVCSEDGFACDFLDINQVGEPQRPPLGELPLLEVGTADQPIPAAVTARIRLHYQAGMSQEDSPALVCCSARMELHGAPMSRTWIKLAGKVEPGSATVQLAEAPRGWRVGHEVIVTGSRKPGHLHSFRPETGWQQTGETEHRVIERIDAASITLDAPLEFAHFGHGDFRSEIANLSRNVIVESAEPSGIRGHTMYHRFSRGGISYARFAHLGKEGVLGRYAIHYHLVGDTMRGSRVMGAAIVDSHNRWITIHGTQYLLVRDCVGFGSVGHGYFMEDGTEVYNLLDRNLGVHAYLGRRLPNQVMPFDPNDGAAFWWANGRNSIVRNVACENDRYGFRYDSQLRSNFDSRLSILMPDGNERIVDIRTIPISRFELNESHTEGLYSMAFAGTDGVGPDTRHPHRLQDLTVWQTHYALRSQLPTMLIENVRIDHAAYGIYRPWFENHVYRNLRISSVNAEPFNRGLDDRSLQHGKVTVDRITFSGLSYGSQMPLIQISANNASGDAETHFRNLRVSGRQRDDRWPLINLGGGPRLQPSTLRGVPIYVHNQYGTGRHAKVVSTRAKDLLADGSKYRKQPPLTGDESLVAEVTGVTFPNLLDPVDDLPPATMITSVRRLHGSWQVKGVSHDNGEIESVTVNGQQAELFFISPGVVDWEIRLSAGGEQDVIALARDRGGNREQTPHRVAVTRVRAK